MPKCKINGKPVEVPAGSTIIQAFKAAGEDICHYCWHPGLSVAGVCRLCMVEIEGQPKLQIACNTVVNEGMVVTNQSEKVKDTVQWGLDFHLINHPLDCPICDQAGECGLQDQYMQFGKYDSEMAERKVKKHKVVDLGPRVVLDSERCILCSRCVRFTDEVSKSHELGIFNRGDRSEIGTFDGKPLNNNYSLNTVDICPVGALTSKDFRFRQRVWYLRETNSICTGCSTGCNVKVYYNEEGLWRIKPRENPEINGFWMCDEGRDVYKYANRKDRLLQAKVGKAGDWRLQDPVSAAADAGELLKNKAAEKGSDSVALVLTGQYTNEEYEAIVKVFDQGIKTKNVYHWVNNKESFDSFDGLLLRGDRNPNTTGLLQILEKHKLSATWDDLVNKLSSGKIEVLAVAGPENQAVFPDISEKLKLFSKARHLIWLTANPNSDLDQISVPTWQLPLKTYIEKSGTFVNFKAIAQKVSAAVSIVPEALTLHEVAATLTGDAVRTLKLEPTEITRKQNYFTQVRGAL